MNLPRSTVLLPTGAPPLRWGVMGPGWIAHHFVAALGSQTRQEVVAVGSREFARAATFATEMGIPHAHGGYAALVADPDVDVVYVATPHRSHYACAALAIRAGKHVLVEKPLTVNAAQARLLTDLAAEYGVLCAEALWSSYLPKYDVLRRILASGMIGDVTAVLADHGERFDASHRIMNAELAGGPLYDLGTYPIALALDVLDEITAVAAIGHEAPSGVNGQLGIVLADAAGRQAVLHTTVLADTPNAAVVIGTSGTLTLPGAFYRPGCITVTRHADSSPMTYREPEIGYDGLAYEAAEVARSVSGGLLEAPSRPLTSSVRLLTVMDEIRRQIGVRYEEDEPPDRQLAK